MYLYKHKTKDYYIAVAIFLLFIIETYEGMEKVLWAIGN